MDKKDLAMMALALPAVEMLATTLGTIFAAHQWLKVYREVAVAAIPHSSSVDTALKEAERAADRVTEKMKVFEKEVKTKIDEAKAKAEESN